MYREVVMAPQEHFDKVFAALSKTAFSNVQYIPYGAFHLFGLLGSLQKLMSSRDVLTKSGIAFNTVLKNDDNRVRDPCGYHLAVRFNHMGECTKTFSPVRTEANLAEVEYLSKLLWPDGAVYCIANMRAECIAQRDEWDNQVAYGQLYSMMHLLGAEE